MSTFNESPGVTGNPVACSLTKLGIGFLGIVRAAARQVVPAGDSWGPLMPVQALTVVQL